MATDPTREGVAASGQRSGFEWGLTPDDFAALTKATRAADELMESGATGGGGTRHWLRDCFLPALANEGLVVRPHDAPSDPELVRCDGGDGWGCFIPHAACVCEKEGTPGMRRPEALRVGPPDPRTKWA